MTQLALVILFWVLPVLLSFLGLHRLLRLLHVHRHGHLCREGRNSSAPSETERKEAGLLWYALFWGALTALLLAVPERYVEQAQDSLFSWFWQFSGLEQLAWVRAKQEAFRILWRSFAAIALWEEGAKYCLLCCLLRHHFRNQAEAETDPATGPTVLPSFCLVGLAMALGFSAMENLWYMVNYGVASIYWRLLSSTVVHLCLGGLTALCLGRMQDSEKRRQPPKLPLKSPLKLPLELRAWPCLGRALLWHGSYNTALMFGQGFTAMTILLLLLFFSVRKLWKVLG
ncbi:PrsW family glutamic-type intramembrane protease [Candidatus Haliotispira prima]|uniref:PrsW family glutamic-type intramembrane protease n=1 Tax=Candidatus Haliotispira prima TaxID=3034016 RepID=A0ABY8MGQ6_9SPIO|nr:PrsW family glutamic-type intramembrane protease [Candidatus Haliotispira prima]